MKYAASYTSKIKLKDFDEIIIRYDRQEMQLLPFLEEHSAQNIILSIADVDKFCKERGWESLNTYYTKFKNISIRFYEGQPFKMVDTPVVDALAHLDMPFFFGLYVTNFDQLHYLLDLGPKQVYLVEEICFCLRGAKRLCEQHQAQIRVFPNVGQASVKTTPAIKKFFIRPEDIEEYSDVVDTLEFWGPLDRQDILLRIYKKGKWFGDLKDLLLDFDISFDSRRIVPGFARIRKECERKCMKGEHCMICDRVYGVSEKLKEKDFLIK